jgi:uroporphyrinogen decarboxylase
MTSATLGGTSDMTSMERVLNTLTGKPTDRVPLFLPVTLHGAKLLGLTIRDYFSKAEHVVEGQLRLRARYGHDFFYPLSSAAAEAGAWGCEVVYHDDGPPNTGAPVVTRFEQISGLAVPRLDECPGLLRVLEVERQLHQRAAGEVPILGVIIGPTSLPIMQLGFERYLDLLSERPELFERLLQLNEEFCVTWANAQLRAGCTAIGIFEPMISPAMADPSIRRRWAIPSMRRCIARIQGPVVMHGGSARMRGALEDVIAAGAAIVAVSAEDSLEEMAAAAAGRITLVGNLNALDLRRWGPDEAAEQVKRAVAAAGPGRRFILADNHGEIPWQVPDRALLALAEAVRAHGGSA